MRSGEPDPAPGVVQDRVARGLIDTDSVPIDWVRRHANYLAPGGAGDMVVNSVAGLRSLLSVYLVLGVLFLAVFGSIDAIRYLGDDVSRGGAPEALYSHTSSWTAQLLPLGHIFPDAWRGPWLALAEGSLWLGVVPLMLAYWLVSQDRPESFVAPVLVSAAIAAGDVAAPHRQPPGLGRPDGLRPLVLGVLGGGGTGRRAAGSTHSLPADARAST